VIWVLKTVNLFQALTSFKFQVSKIAPKIGNISMSAEYADVVKIQVSKNETTVSKKWTSFQSVIYHLWR